ncbi:MAG: hypothetical protein IT578_10875 [Verrucomicrobiae bacterium]|nr:hypothetical protein [Verrucomicrobiae bacterium]
MSSRRHVALLLAFVAFTLIGCADFRHRTYRCGEAAPVRPYAFVLREAEAALRDGRVRLRVRIEVTRHSSEPGALSRDRFALRVGRDAETLRDRNLVERLGFEAVRFAPGQTVSIVLPFTLSHDALTLPLRLVVDRQADRRGRERLTLLEVKRNGRPPVLPANGEWRRVTPSRG